MPNPTPSALRTSAVTAAAHEGRCRVRAGRGLGLADGGDALDEVDALLVLADARIRAIVRDELRRAGIEPAP